MEKNPTLYMLIGLPGSGKSTWIKNCNINNCVVLSTDDYIERQAQRLGKTYDELFRISIAAADVNLAKDLNEAIDTGKNIIWDQTNLSNSVRAKKLYRIPNNYRKVAIVFRVPDDVLEQRLDNRPGKTIPEHVINNMKKSFEYPKLSEGFDEIMNSENWSYNG